MIVVSLRGHTLDNLELLGLTSCVVGCVTLAPGLPATIKALALATFVLLGPGAAVLVWVRGLPGYLSGVLVPLIGVAVTILVSYLAVLENMWHPAIQLLVMAAGCAASLLVRLLHRTLPTGTGFVADPSEAVAAQGPTS
jgi:hypothetical protein